MTQPNSWNRVNLHMDADQARAPVTQRLHVPSQRAGSNCALCSTGARCPPTFKAQRDGAPSRGHNVWHEMHFNELRGPALVQQVQAQLRTLTSGQGLSRHGLNTW